MQKCHNKPRFKWNSQSQSRQIDEIGGIENIGQKSEINQTMAEDYGVESAEGTLF
jgi:hypothetical protein